METPIRNFVIAFISLLVWLTGTSLTVAKESCNNFSNATGVHFKIDGKQYDISLVRSMYISSSHVFVIYNTALPNFPDTIITLSIGKAFTGGPGSFKSDSGSTGFIFGFIVYTGGHLTSPEVGYGAGKDDHNSGETVAATPVSITVTGFSTSGSISAYKGNVTAQGRFSGTVYDILHKKTAALTDGTFNVHP